MENNTAGEDPENEFKDTMTQDTKRLNSAAEKIVWEYITWWHVGPLHLIDGIMRKENYLHISQTHLPNFMENSAILE